MVRICPATLADLQALVDLENELFTSDRIPRRQFRYLLTKANAIRVKIEEDGALAGYLILLRRRNSRNLRIYSIGVSPSAQQRGHGRRLLRFAEEMAAEHNLPSLTLEVCEQNDGAIRLYTTAGFYQYGRTTGYYEDGCTALLFRKDIEQEGDTRQ